MCYSGVGEVSQEIQNHQGVLTINSNEFNDEAGSQFLPLENDQDEVIKTPNKRKTPAFDGKDVTPSKRSRASVNINN